MGMPFAAMVVMASTGAGAVIGGLGFNAALWQEDNEFIPKLWGWDVRPLVLVGGLVAPFLFGPLFGGLLFGAAAASLVSFDTSMRTKEAADQFLAQQQLDAPAETRQIEDRTRGEKRRSRWLESIVKKIEEEAA